MDAQLYDQLAAVAASLFARMAVIERSEGGRARRLGVPAPTVASFGANGPAIPRFAVAQLMQRAVGAPMSQLLCKLERGRLAAPLPPLFRYPYFVNRAIRNLGPPVPPCAGYRTPSLHRHRYSCTVNTIQFSAFPKAHPGPRQRRRRPSAVAVREGPIRPFGKKN